MTLEGWIGWAAGIYEGEGCLSLGDHHYPFIAINNTDRDVLERFQSVVGAGNINGPYERHSKNHFANAKPVHQYRCYKHTEVERIMRMFQPYLCERRLAKALELGVLSSESQTILGVKQ